MRNLQINIEARPGTQDNTYAFSSDNQADPTRVYEPQMLQLSYSILSSQSLSVLKLSMRAPYGPDNILRGGQPITIHDNGRIVFEGVLLALRYIVTENNESMVELMLAPSIFQLTLLPMVFDQEQADQLKAVTGVDVPAILIANKDQKVAISDLLDYVITNSDYQKIFKKKIIAQDVPDNAYLMAQVGESRDSALRSSLNPYNVIMYQREDGDIIIRQLDTTVTAPFNIDVRNEYVGIPAPTAKPYINIINQVYEDNSALTNTVISNYALLSPGTTVSSGADQLTVSYTPNPKYFPRIEQLKNSGWFIGVTGRTQINQNILSDPTLSTILAGYRSGQNQYILDQTQKGIIKDDFFTAYQSLVTAKEMAQSLENYAKLEFTINLNDSLVPDDSSNILGSFVNISNCDLEVGVIATVIKTYSVAGAFLSAIALPEGSITGYYKS